MKKLSVSAIVGLFVLVSLSHAQEAKSPVDVSGVVYADYFYDLTEGIAPAKKTYFELSRLYISAARVMSDNIKVKATLEGSQPMNTLFIKNAFVEFGDVMPGQNIRAGVIGTPWIAYEEKIWRYRFAAKTFMDFAGMLQAADHGLGLSGKLANKIVDYDFIVVNGEGYKVAEVSEEKDFATRVSLETMPGAKIHAYQQLGNTGTAGNNRNRTILGLSYEQKAYSAMVYYLMAKDLAMEKNGFTVFGSCELSPWLSFLARYESFDADTSSSNNAWNRMVAGFATNLSNDVQLALDYQVKSFENTAVQGNNQSIIMTHIGIKF